MRFTFKTSYEQDIALAKHGGHRLWYGLLIAALLIAPLLLPEYWLAQLSFVLIYSIVGLGLMLLAGFTGQVSIGHAAFMGVGAYAQAYLTNHGVPFFVALAIGMTLSAAVGVLLLFVPRFVCDRHLGSAQPSSRADRPCLCGNPRLGDFRSEHGHQPRAV